MKKSRGFTLIELLIVTVVIVTLMGIVFRLMPILGRIFQCMIQSGKGFPSYDRQ